MNLIFPDTQLENFIFTLGARPHRVRETLGALLRVKWKYDPPTTKNKEKTKNKKIKQSKEYHSRQYILVHEAGSQMKTHFLSNFDSYIVYTFE